MVEIYADGETNTYEIADISTDLSTVLFGKEGDFVKFDLEDGIFVQTDENDIIIDMIEKLDKTNYEIEINRVKAINRGIQLLNKNDILLVLGKGHETYQIIGDKKIDMDDKEIILSSI